MGVGPKVLYALEFLSGMGTGEASARRWSDLDLTAKPLARLEARTAWNSRMKIEKSTKTLVEKVIPVHSVLRAILEAWKAKGWKEHVGREPKADGLIVPRQDGQPRRVDFTLEQFYGDWTGSGCPASDSTRAGRRSGPWPWTGAPTAPNWTSSRTPAS